MKKVNIQLSYLSDIDYLCPDFMKTGKVRKYMAVVFLLIFGWYFSSINLFPHIHTVNGNSIVHSHFGGTADHGHSETEYTVIDLLSSFQTETADMVCISITPLYPSEEDTYSRYISQYFFTDLFFSRILRGPPQV